MYIRSIAHFFVSLRANTSTVGECDVSKAVCTYGQSYITYCTVRGILYCSV